MSEKEENLFQRVRHFLRHGTDDGRKQGIFPSQEKGSYGVYINVKRHMVHFFFNFYHSNVLKALLNFSLKASLLDSKTTLSSLLDKQS